MKKMNLIITTLLAISFGLLSAQNPNFVKQTDSLQDGSTLIRLLLSDSTFVQHYLAINPVDTSLIGNNIINALPPADQSNPDFETENKNLFGNKTSALPWDICYNPDLNKYYIYNYRKIMIYDRNGNGSFENPIQISDFDEINTNLMEPDNKKKLVYYNNYLYCTSNTGSLLVINCTTNQIAASYSSNQMSSIYKSDIRLMGADIYWYYTAIGYPNTQSCLKKISGTTLNASIDLPGLIINDWCFDNPGNLYLASNHGIYKYSPGLILISSNLNNPDHTNIAHFDNGIAQRIISKTIDLIGLKVYETNLDFDYDVIITCPILFNLDFNPNTESIHFTGLSTTNRSYYGKIIYDSQTGKLVEENPLLFFDNPIAAMVFNGTDTWLGAKNKVVKIDQNNSTSNYPAEGYCTSLSKNNNTGINIAGTNALSGDFFEFNSQSQIVAFETGGVINGVCQKFDKTFYSIYKNNGRGYILCDDQSAITSIIPTDEYFDPLAVFCFDQDIYTDILVAYESRDISDAKRLRFAKINSSSLQITILESLEFGLIDGLTYNTIKHLDQNLFYSEYTPNGCPQFPLIHFYYDSAGSLSWRSTLSDNCPDMAFDPATDYLYTLNRCNQKVNQYDLVDLSLISEMSTGGDYPYSLCYNASGDKILISGVESSDQRLVNLRILDPSSGTINSTSFLFNSEGITVTDLSLSKDQFVYGFSKKYWYKIDQNYAITQYMMPTVLETYDVHYHSQKNLFYIHSYNNHSNQAVVYILDATNNTFLDPVVNGNQYLVNTSTAFDLSSYSQQKAILFAANDGMTTSTQITCPFTRGISSPWQWLSFPRLQRDANNPVGAVDVLENINPLPLNLTLWSNEDGRLLSIQRRYGSWQLSQYSEITSIKGYKLNIQNQSIYKHTMYGTDMHPGTPIPLYLKRNDNRENWIGYFLHQALEPEDAFAGIWDKLQKIQTQHWTMIKMTPTGPWLRPANVRPLTYGEAVIVEVSENCTLYWNNDGETPDMSERSTPQSFQYTEYDSYIPWYIQTDSLEGVVEIGLMAGDICIGASTVEAGDTLVEVNAYNQAVPPGTPVEIYTTDGLKSTPLRRSNYQVKQPFAASLEKQQIYTGEAMPWYYISFGNPDQNIPSHKTSVFASSLKVSPNPVTISTDICFSVESESHVEIVITNLVGKTIATLISGKYLPGQYQTSWQTANNGSKTENGIYILSLTADGKLIENKKIVVIK